MGIIESMIVNGEDCHFKFQNRSWDAKFVEDQSPNLVSF